VLAGALEAVLGAVFEDAGYPASEALVRRWMAQPLEGLAREEANGWKDPRSLLQEIVQSTLGETPVYDVTVQDGPPHQPRFGVVVRVGDRVLAAGEGPSKREASRHAAEVALTALREQS
jgi:ribonuclease-3